MGIRIKILAILLIIFTGFAFNTCKKNMLGCTESSYFFTVDAKIFPDKDSLNIGDTIWVEINIPTTLPDQNNEMIDFSKANNLGTNIGFVKLMNDSPIVLDNAVADFKFNLEVGKEINSANASLYKQYLFQESGGKYIFRLSIIPKSGGTFSFNLENAVNVMRKGNSCPKAGFAYLLRNTTDQHYYLYPGGIGVAPAGADYYFYVR